ncbi:MAG: hypothetical protein U9R27_07475 [Campylobacterota bacterium]|nr:hypothetical protein [Campylobacterota bacterium]
MKYAVIFFIPMVICAKIHYAKVEPYESVVLKSAVSGQVIEVDLDAEGKMIGDKEVIHLDDHLDKRELMSSKKNLETTETILGINREIVSSLGDTLKRQKGYYERLNRLSTASKTQKDSAFNSFVSAKNQYLSTKEKIETLKNQILDIEYRITKLEDSIKKKNITLKGRYLYRLAVRKGDFVNPGSALATIQDHSRAKLILFLEPSELKGIQAKRVFIDGKETNYKVDKVWSSADDKFISSYRAEIYIDTPESHFSRLVKVELK